MAMRALRHLASAVLAIAAVLLAATGVMFVLRALGGHPPEAGPTFIAVIGALFLAIAAVLGWGAWTAQRSGSRAQLLLLALVAASFALIPINSLIGPFGYALNALCGAVAGVALLALLMRWAEDRDERLDGQT
jgi:peptidoglycan/LPS O-acetylase OafA/YrhL